MPIDILRFLLLSHCKYKAKFYIMQYKVPYFRKRELFFRSLLRLRSDYLYKMIIYGPPSFDRADCTRKPSFSATTRQFGQNPATLALLRSQARIDPPRGKRYRTPKRPLSPAARQLLAANMRPATTKTRPESEHPYRAKSPRLISHRMRSSHSDLRGGIVQHRSSVAAHLAASSTRLFPTRRWIRARSRWLTPTL